MLAFIYSFVILLVETSEHSKSGMAAFYDEYLNIPGFEAWKFVNLTIFVLLLVYIAKRPLSDAFKAKREAIRADLIRAEAEKQAALAQLTSAEAKLVALEQEKAAILQRARDEAAAEKSRIAAEAEADVSKMLQQSASEIARLAQLTRAELRRLSAEESIRLAEQKLRSKITPESDGRLIKASIDAIGGLN
ncbi:MAG: hypothetical protein ACR2IH_01315 [Pyrinomonadaceae bacterium]